MARVWIIPRLVEAVTGTRLPLGRTTKNSEILDTGPNGVEGTHPPLTLAVEVSAANLKSAVAAPVF